MVAEGGASHGCIHLHSINLLMGPKMGCGQAGRQACVLCFAMEQKDPPHPPCAGGLPHASPPLLVYTLKTFLGMELMWDSTSCIFL